MSDTSTSTPIIRDDWPAVVTEILKEYGLQKDPQYHGEMVRFFDRPDVKHRYYRRAGLTVDALGELIWDHGVTRERPTCNDVLELLEILFVNPAAVKQARRRRANTKTAETAIDREVRKAKGTRLRKYQCDCGQIIQGTRKTDVICGPCFRINGITESMPRVTKLPEEILAEYAGELMERESA